MWAGVRTLVTGGHGFLGTHLVAALRHRGADPVPVGRADADLRNMEATQALFSDVRPQAVIHCAVQGGGIGWMQHHPVESGRDNTLMNVNVLDAAWRSGADLFLGASSACCYPRSPPVPFQETDLWNGYPEPTNGPYALSKRVMMDLGRAYTTQHGMRSAFAIFANLYGPGDDITLERAHVVAALIIRSLAQPDELVVWGTGAATREHLFVLDAVDGLLALGIKGVNGPLNIGTGVEVSVAELAQQVALATGYSGPIRFDSDKPDGQPRKCLDVSLAAARMGWRAPTTLTDGLANTVAWYRGVLSC